MVEAEFSWIICYVKLLQQYRYHILDGCCAIKRKSIESEIEFGRAGTQNLDLLEHSMYDIVLCFIVYEYF